MNKNKLYFLMFAYMFFVSPLLIFNYIYSVDLELDNSGNWYEKLQWWRKAKPEYEQLSQFVQEVKTIANNLLSKKDSINKQIEQFYISIKVTSTQALSNINKVIEELKPVIEDVDQSDLAAQAMAKQKDLEKLKENLETLSLLQKRLEQAYNTIKDQINKADTYQDKALDNFEQIEEVLDDQKARYLYESIEATKEDIKAIAGYIQIDLNGYISQLTFQVKDLLSSMSRSIKNLEQNGILIRPLTKEEIEQQELAKIKAAQDAKAKAEADRKAKEERQRGSGIWASIKGFFSSIWSSITSFFKSIFG